MKKIIESGQKLDKNLIKRYNVQKIHQKLRKNVENGCKLT